MVYPGGGANAYAAGTYGNVCEPRCCLFTIVLLGDAMKKRGDYFSKYFDNSTKHSVLVILADVPNRIQHLPEMVIMLVVAEFNEKMASLIPLKDVSTA